MGNFNKKEEKEIEVIKEKIEINYRCKKCGEIPLLYFSNNDFNLFCSSHKIKNIPIKKFYDYISFDNKCSVCKLTSKTYNYFYCFKCDKIYCNKCIKGHNQDINNFHILININQKNSICKLHNKNYEKFCINCKLNLCKLCENHNNHYIELFKDIYPLKEDIEIFNKVTFILKKKMIEKRSNGEFNNNQEDKNQNKKKSSFEECIKIKRLLVKSFSNNIFNYNYINNLNNILRTTSENDNRIEDSEKINYENINVESKEILNNNNIEKKILIKSLIKYNTKDVNSITWCIKKLNIIKINPNQQNLELLAIGGGNNNILILNIINFRVYQILDKHKNTVYSLDQFKDSPNFLFSSSEDRTVNIYKLNASYKFQLVQTIKKSEDKSGNEINKVICLSNRLLVTSDQRSITIWKSNQINNIKYEDFHEIIINKDTCHLLEVNASIFVATQYENFQVYKNDGNNFPLIGELNIESHGYSSNGLSKIDDNIVCSGGNNEFYLVSIEPLQVIQKFPIQNTYVYGTYCTKDDYLYCKGKESILQYRIIKDEDKNFVELMEMGKHLIKECLFSYEKAILPFDDGRIFFVENKKGNKFYQLYA